MRSTFCLATALLATNVWLLVDRAPKLEVEATVHVEPTIRDDERRLQWLRQARYAGFRLEACSHRDPLATLDADVDPAPGREHVIGNRRFGVVMFAESGELLATMRGVGCNGDAFASGDQSLSISFDAKLILRTRRLAADGEYLEAHIVERRRDELVTLTTVDLGGARTDWEAYGKLYMRDGAVEVKTHGRQRVDGAWIAVDDHRTYALRQTDFFIP